VAAQVFTVSSVLGVAEAERCQAMLRHFLRPTVCVQTEHKGCEDSPPGNYYQPR